jgi:bifunctional oligoribonuclease and PAP phosphatase NrnA
LKGINADNFKKIQELCGRFDNILIITHRNADGDAIGSSLGLYHILKKLGKEVNVCTPNEFPDFLHWMPSCISIYRYNCSSKKVQKILADAQIIFFLDFNSLSRIYDIDKLIPKSNAIKILIDHHPNPDIPADYIISETEVSSTAELVYEFIESCGHKNLISEDAAQCLFTGIMTDTNSFNVNCFRPRTFAIVSELLSIGVNYDYIHYKVFNNFSESRIRLLGHSLSKKMKIIPGTDVAYIALSKKELLKFNFMPGDTEGFVNYPLSINGIKVSALFLEKKDNVKISFRSKDDIPVNIFAQEHFSGGGHVNAAGGEYKSSLRKTINKFIRLIPEFMNQQS